MMIDRLEPHLPFEFVKIFNEPDGNFPNGVPNPRLEENRAATIEAVNTAASASAPIAPRYAMTDLPDDGVPTFLASPAVSSACESSRQRPRRMSGGAISEPRVRELISRPSYPRRNG